jgi:dihydrolipoamide dehydrogenase
VLFVFLSKSENTPVYISKDAHMYDLLIIGGGPAGYVAAERAGHQGLNVVLFEKNRMGGVCLNEGCIPTKTLLYSAKMFDYAQHSEKYGVFTEKVNYDYSKMVSRKEKVVRRLVAGVESSMKQNGVTVVRGEAYIEGKSDNEITVSCSGETYVGSNLLVCTGSKAFIPPIPGILESGDVVATNREILAFKKAPDSLVVIGGGVIGMEFASLFNSLGTKVTVLEMLPEILNGLDAELSIQLREIYTRKGVDFQMGARVTKVDGCSVSFEKNGQFYEVCGEKILISVGRKPVTKGFGLENLGVKLNRGGIQVDDRMRTNISNVYAAGDVTGFSLLAHTASREGEVVVNNLTGGADAMKYDAIPGVVYTNPEVAGAGLTEEQATLKGIGYRLIKLPMAFAGRFVAENEGVNGVCKVLVADDNKILGVHLLGNPASELIFGACMAIEQGLSLELLQQVVFPHPTVSEIFRESAFAG